MSLMEEQNLFIGVWILQSSGINTAGNEFGNKMPASGMEQI